MISQHLTVTFQMKSPSGAMQRNTQRLSSLCGASPTPSPQTPLRVAVSGLKCPSNPAILPRQNRTLSDRGKEIMANRDCFMLEVYDSEVLKTI